ncbi:hypothetical protein ASZ90_010784 [hydrocarbon metagenome]|uniref:Integral membrane protein n=1 Tax=hydrocarbon metagenome TaxID=938273 RepID=A0A0W8FF42_9ZZZZ|nr:TIGR00341 family protein [Methanomicrobiaceae archaeon]
MKKVVITLSAEQAEKLEAILSESILKDALYFIEEYPDRKKFTVFVLDETLEEMISKTHDILEGQQNQQYSRPLWTGLLTRIENVMEKTDRNTLVEVYSPDFIISPFLDELKKKSEETDRPKEKSSGEPLIEKIVAATERYSRFDRNTFILASIAGLVALIGMFLNNIGIIIGAMLVSPLLGPIYSMAINMTLGNLKAVLRCSRIIVAMVGLLIGVSMLITFLLSLVIALPLTSEIAMRMDASAVYILMAALLGFASIIALYRGIPESIAGVAIAAALLPPAVVTGIAVVLFPGGAFKAFMLTCQNVVGLITGSVIAAVMLQIYPRDGFDQLRARQFITRIAWILAFLIFLLVILSLIQ